MQLEEAQNISLLTANSVIKILVQDWRDQGSVSSSKLYGQQHSDRKQKNTSLCLSTFSWPLDNKILIFF